MNGWTTNPYLPEGWLCHKTQDNNIRLVNLVWNQFLMKHISDFFVESPDCLINIFRLYTSEGVRLRSYKTAAEYMMQDALYNQVPSLVSISRQSPMFRRTSTGCTSTQTEERTLWRSRTSPRYLPSWSWSSLSKRSQVGCRGEGELPRTIRTSLWSDLKKSRQDNHMFVNVWPMFFYLILIPWCQVVQARPHQQTVTVTEEWKENEFLPQGWRWLLLNQMNSTLQNGLGWFLLLLLCEWEGGSKAVWNFSENSSDLVAWPVPKHIWDDHSGFKRLKLKWIWQTDYW